MLSINSFCGDRLTIRQKTVIVLETYNRARNSDNIFLKDYAKHHFDIDLPLEHLPCSIASILRERRIVQKARPDLRATESIQKQRECHSKSYQSFYGKEHTDQVHDFL